MALRNIRREANDQLKGLEKNKKISQDQLHQWMDKVQKSTDKYIEKVDGVLRRQGERDFRNLEVKRG